MDGTLLSEQLNYAQRTRARPREGARAAAPGVEGHAALRLAAQGLREGRARGGESPLLEISSTTTGWCSSRCSRCCAACARTAFKTYIVTGNGVEYARAFAERAFGIPPGQVIGRFGNQKFEMRAGKPVLVKPPGLHFEDHNVGKPVAIHRAIGRRPIAAFGNSDGDLAMLQWTCAAEGARLCL